MQLGSENGSVLNVSAKEQETLLRVYIRIKKENGSVEHRQYGVSTRPRMRSATERDALGKEYNSHRGGRISRR